MDAIKSVSVNIHRLRKAAGLSQDRFSDLVGVSKTQVVNWEKGRHYPSIGVVLIICKKFNITPNELLGFQSGVEYHSKSELEILKQQIGSQKAHIQTLIELVETKDKIIDTYKDQE